MNLRGKNLEKIIFDKYERELKDILLEMYIVDKLNQKQIAEKLGVTAAAICLKFKEYEIPKRPKKEIMKGFKHSDEVKKMLSKLHKGKTISDEQKRKISEANKGRRLVGNYEKFKGVKKRKDGYVGIYKPDHPFSDSQGYVMEHRLVMEEKIGRLLTKTEVVHHINEKRADNSPDNLHLFKNSASHMYFHLMERNGNGVELKYEYK